MFKVTRELIKARQIHTKYMMKVVSVKQIGGGRRNDCFGNACDYKEKNKRNHVVSGWLVNKYDPLSNSTEIIQHFWNFNEDGFLIDTTPINASEYEYVLDVDILIYGQMHYDHISSCVCSSLWFKDGKFDTVDLVDGEIIKNSINELTDENLFNAVRIKENVDDDFLQVLTRAREMEMA
jgi:hypothetical protein